MIGNPNSTHNSWRKCADLKPLLLRGGIKEMWIILTIGLTTFKNLCLCVFRAFY